MRTGKPYRLVTGAPRPWLVSQLKCQMMIPTANHVALFPERTWHHYPISMLRGIVETTKSSLWWQSDVCSHTCCGVGLLSGCYGWRCYPCLHSPSRQFSALHQWLGQPRFSHAKGRNGLTWRRNKERRNYGKKKKLLLWHYLGTWDWV
jgi:hypothetical protein